MTFRLSLMYGMPRFCERHCASVSTERPVTCATSSAVSRIGLGARESDNGVLLLTSTSLGVVANSVSVAFQSVWQIHFVLPGYKLALHQHDFRARRARHGLCPDSRLRALTPDTGPDPTQFDSPH
jgi:hypothetical protein